MAAGASACPDQARESRLPCTLRWLSFTALIISHISRHADPQIGLFPRLLFRHRSTPALLLLPRCGQSDRLLEEWLRRDEPMMLLRVPKDAELPPGVAKYLATEQGRRARQAYKCRMRNPWYSVPDVKVPDFFLTYMSGRAPSLVRNSAAATCANAIHGVRVHHPGDVSLIIRRWSSPFVRLSCELEGHPLGGGMLKLEPREASSDRAAVLRKDIDKGPH